MALPGRRGEAATPQLRTVLPLTTSGWSPRFGRLWATSAEIWSDAVVVHVTFGYDQSTDPDRFPAFFVRDDDGDNHPTFCVASAGDGRRWQETVTIEVDPFQVRRLDVHVAWAGPATSPADDGEILCSVPLRRGLQLVEND